MAKRELSSTLKNLKFMQRGAPKVEKAKQGEELVVEIKEVTNVSSPNNTQKKKCVVIIEGNPHPGSVKGRMSFQSFNPVIDKLNEEAANPGQSQMPSPSSDGKAPDRENGSLRAESDRASVAKLDGYYEDDDECVTEIQQPNKPPKDLRGGRGQQYENNSRGSHKKQKREKLDWNHLRPPKAQKRQD
ncbi:hypothetical protein C5167_033832 [Papaver somniferum]|uniref:M-phase phosphoprotein 6 n=1 Tax=Papaver somniferum TaxID=3469 RepID=A0A4Y7KF54_PAPSO|nr:uncharacterized protein LOC113298806 [Papaver somniferum]XP_026403423.1 uncharacterized protein LOC113298806 [Papaver somniferum]RZC70668.1 hypothetical protein C5167_033832 [Papaver somniferum]